MTSLCYFLNSEGKLILESDLVACIPRGQFYNIDVHYDVPDYRDTLLIRFMYLLRHSDRTTV
jgi:hypothetical protein